MPWTITNSSPSYSASGPTTLVTSNYTVLANDVIEGSTLTMSFPSSYTYNGTTFVLSFVQVNGSTQHNISGGEEVDEDKDVLAVYGTFGFGP